MNEVVCPGCALAMPRDAHAPYDGYYNCSAECWSVYTEVLAKEYSNAVLFGQVHQMTVDTYAVQHAGARHPDKSVAVHLVGLHLMLLEGVRPPFVPPLLQQLASRTRTWPHFDPPADRGALTVFDVATASDHAAVVRAWAKQVWNAWMPHHAAVERFAKISR
jgi:hypothetical protein